MGEIVERVLGESPNVAQLEELQRSIHAAQSARCAYLHTWDMLDTCRMCKRSTAVTWARWIPYRRGAVGPGCASLLGMLWRSCMQPEERCARLSLLPCACRVELRQAYIRRSHEFAGTLRRGEKGARNERTPDDAMRYQSVMFALSKALDKAGASSMFPLALVEAACCAAPA